MEDSRISLFKIVRSMVTSVLGMFDL